MKENIERVTAAAIRDIRAKHSMIESHMMWLIRSEQRFKVGQRVEFSRRARDRGWPKRKRSAKGFVKAIDSFSIVVQLDGQRQRCSYHHAFFNPVSGPRLF